MTDSSVDAPLTLTRALLSVANKRGIVELAEALARRGVELVSTGGTAAALREAGLTVVDVSSLTGFPEMMEGRVKTLHPMVHGGLLFDRASASHHADAEQAGIAPIDLLVSNLYPFAQTVASGADAATCIENIDIGGPAMIRAAAKNHAHVGVVVDPGDYPALIAAIDAGDAPCLPAVLRTKLAVKAFTLTSAYDAAVSGWMRETLAPTEEAPSRLVLAGEKRLDLRYGENPHQRAAFYVADAGRHGVGTSTLSQGKALSYNNLSDADAAFELVAELARFGKPACVIIKHANPCGAAIGDTLEQAYRRAHACDPVSAFGGVVAFDRPLDAAAARAVTEIFTEVVIAPAPEPVDEVLEIFAEKPALRLLSTDALPDPAAPGRVWRQLAGGFLAQDRDARLVQRSDLRTVTRRAPTPREIDDLLLAWTVAKHVKSNAIVYAKSGATVGVGAGQMSRVDSARIAAWKAKDAAAAAGSEASLTKGSVVASDAFFPFADGLVTAIEAGAAAVIQPGGSKRDDEVIAAADAAGVAMVFTGVRHFRH
ncbi:MAG: bifunctional phosphoribosylaminoimidazolecarboxamide formyltransferase/IMP cyclohydrolase [Rhodobacteraceae bacterium]|nr:bifunctional phosphoribosylaminoimidazolecarboxamide formyltransferase/IMP cyclohydrolase [Paracoccaceae bacterium]